MSAWHILGAGSMGCLWASFLCEHGCTVTLLLKDRSVAALYRDAGGVTIERDSELARFACDSAVGAEAPRWDAAARPTSLVVSTKAYDTVAALGSIRHLLADYRAIVLIQNGMGTLDEIAREFPDLSVHVGVTAHGAYRRSRFHIVHAGQGPTWFGRGAGDPACVTRERIEPLLELDCPVSWDDAIASRMWIKLAINCVINGMTVVLDRRNGDIMAPAHRARIVSLCDEAERVLAAALPAPHSFDLLREVTRVAEATRDNFSSMLQDVRNGKRTEIDYINGYLVSTALRHGIEVPENARLLDELRARLA